MSRAVWKYSLAFCDIQTVRMPLGARILHVAVQHDVPCVWVMVNPSMTLVVDRCIRMYGTDHPVPNDCGAYVGTIITVDDSLVFHVFDQGETPCTG